MSGIPSSQVSSLPMTDSATSTRPTPLGSYSSSKLFKYHKTGNISPNIQIFFQIFKYHETGNIFPGPDTTRWERNWTTRVFHISAVSPRCISSHLFNMKVLVKLGSVSPPPRMATSTLSLQSRRTTSQRTRLLPGVFKRFLLHKIKGNKLAKLRRHASRIHFALIHFG